ncbi:hypothetical protein [Solibacillus sp. FSL H8-0538]|uniref:hypothetical protein n=1 Tax=Solibacillus sp. FSL H8-0538 TaxID=2921400 RepID=UPI0030FC146E
MTNIIDFISKKKHQQEEKLHRIFQKRNSIQDPQQLDKLVQSKLLAVEDHRLFLAFIAYTEEHELDSKMIFREVLQLPKHQFESKYQMKWSAIVQLAFTFLVILKGNDEQAYREFLTIPSQ